MKETRKVMGNLAMQLKKHNRILKSNDAMPHEGMGLGQTR